MAIGMTYETDGGGTKGLRYMRDDGTIATLRSATAKHFVASMTTLETTAKHKAERIRDFYSFRADALKNFASSKMKRVVIVPNKDRVKSAELVEALTRAHRGKKSGSGILFCDRTFLYGEAEFGRRAKDLSCGKLCDRSQPTATHSRKIDPRT